MSANRYIEKLIARKCLTDLITAGFYLTINDGESHVLKDSADPDKCLKAMFSTDEDRIFVRRKPSPTQTCFHGWVYFVYGNDGWDVINDYSINLEEDLKETNAFADQIEGGEL